MEMHEFKNIAILGSTGSIGTQCLDIIDANPDLFRVRALTACNNWELLRDQALKFHPDLVALANPAHFADLKDSLKGSGIKVVSGDDGILEAATLSEVDIVVTALVGFSGVIPTISAIKAGKTIALANKETLVAAGEIVMGLANKHGVEILPVDSEHSAIFQCLVGEKRNELHKIYLTASGGPFRTLSKEQLGKVTLKDALNHPNWTMGAKVTIDSASMMNKGFEMIEAKWLFNCNPSQIDVLVHPQSIIHSMVEFSDGAIKAQLGCPDMHIPIQYALSYPQRLKSPQYSLDWNKICTLTFEAPDKEKFPLLDLAYAAIEKGGNTPCVLNAANEIAVKAFINSQISFTDIYTVVRDMIDCMHFIAHPDLNDILETNLETRHRAENLILNNLHP